VSSHHDHVAFVKALGDLDPSRSPDSDLDFHTLRNLGILLGSIHNLDHELALPLRDDRLFRNDFGAVPFTKHGGHARKHPGTQLHLSVVDAGANPYRTAVGIDQRIHGLNEGFKLAARQRVKVHHRLLTFAHLGLEALGQAEVHEHCLDVFDIDDVSTVFQVVAGIDRRMPVMPSNGAKILQACGRGCDRANLACATSRLAALSSTDRWLMKFWATSSWLRLWLAAGNRQLGLALLDLGQLAVGRPAASAAGPCAPCRRRGS
jgi:hypothetical protein